MKGYKAFKKDSKGMYTDGMGKGTKIYWKKGDRKKLPGELKLCNNGFHFFVNLCFAIDYLRPGNVIYEIAAHGDIVQDTFKACTNDIEIVKRVTKSEWLKCPKDVLYLLKSIKEFKKLHNRGMNHVYQNNAL